MGCFRSTTGCQVPIFVGGYYNLIPLGSAVI